MTKHFVFAAWVLAAVVLAGIPRALSAPVDERPQKAKEAFAAGEYKVALDLFVKLYADTLEPVYLRAIGRCHQNMEQPEKAIASFRDFLRKAKRLAPDKRKEIEAYIAEMEALKEKQDRQRALARAPVEREPEQPARASADGVVPQPAPKPSEATAPVAPTSSEVAVDAHAPRPVPPTTMPASVADRGPSAVPGLGPPMGKAMESAPTAREEVAPPVYRRWWFWTGLTALVGSAVTLFVLTRPGPQDPPCGMDVKC